MKNEIIVVTGMSGAGISTVLKHLEDMNYEVFDNFPLSLVPELCSQTKRIDDNSENAGKKGLAIGVDTRTRGFCAERVLEVVTEIDARLVFITCDDDVLYKRFTETRRRHPLAQQRSVPYGIEKERKILSLIKDNADILIDTSEKSIHDLRYMLEKVISFETDEKLAVSLISFGFRNGVPREADIVMDVRFLKNPHWDSDLKSKTGLEKEVREYISSDEGFGIFMENFKELLDMLLPRYRKEGKSYLTIAIGCTGGKHRSVFTVDFLRKWMEGKGLHVFAEHRDILRS